MSWISTRRSRGEPVTTSAVPFVSGSIGDEQAESAFDTEVRPTPERRIVDRIRGLRTWGLVRRALEAPDVPAGYPVVGNIHSAAETRSCSSGYSFPGRNTTLIEIHTEAGCATTLLWRPGRGVVLSVAIECVRHNQALSQPIKS